MHFVNEADKVVTEHFKQGFVDLRNGRLARIWPENFRFIADNVDSTLLRVW